MSYKISRCNHPLNIFSRPSTTKTVTFYCQAPTRHTGEHFWEVRVGNPEKDGKDFFIKATSTAIDKLK